MDEKTTRLLFRRKRQRTAQPETGTPTERRCSAGAWSQARKTWSSKSSGRRTPTSTSITWIGVQVCLVCNPLQMLEARRAEQLHEFFHYLALVCKYVCIYIRKLYARESAHKIYTRNIEQREKHLFNKRE